MKSVIFWSVVLLSFRGGLSPETALAQPNIVVFMAEQLGWQDTSEPFWRDTTYWNRHHHTPHIEQLARRGSKFVNAYAAPTAEGTRAAVLTGVQAGWPQGAVDRGPLFLPELLERKGYRIGLPEAEAETEVEERGDSVPFFWWVDCDEPTPERVDARLGEVLHVLQQRGLRDKTAVLFLSGGGAVVAAGRDSAAVRAETAPPPNFPLRGGGGSPFEGGLRVPLLISWPTVADTARQVRVPVAAWDLMPTLLEMTQVKGRYRLSDRFDGESLVLLLQGARRLERRRPLTWHHVDPEDATAAGAGVRGGGAYSVIRQGAWKLIYRYEGQGRTSLYQLREDIFEQIDHGQNPVQQERRERMARRLTEQLRRIYAAPPRVEAGWALFPDGSAYRPPRRSNPEEQRGE